MTNLPHISTKHHRNRRMVIFCSYQPQWLEKYLESRWPRAPQGSQVVQWKPLKTQCSSSDNLRPLPTPCLTTALSIPFNIKYSKFPSLLGRFCLSVCLSVCLSFCSINLLLYLSKSLQIQLITMPCKPHTPCVTGLSLMQVADSVLPISERMEKVQNLLLFLVIIPWNMTL